MVRVKVRGPSGVRVSWRAERSAPWRAPADAECAIVASDLVAVLLLRGRCEDPDEQERGEVDSESRSRPRRSDR